MDPETYEDETERPEIGHSRRAVDALTVACALILAGRRADAMAFATTARTEARNCIAAAADTMTASPSLAAAKALAIWGVMYTTISMTLALLSWPVGGNSESWNVWGGIE